MGVVSVVSLKEATTGSAPTTAEQGVLIEPSTKSYRIIVSADEGQTLSGAGAIRMYHRNAETGWGRNPDLDLEISVSGVRSQVFSDVFVGPPIGRMVGVPDGVTVSSGNLTIRYEFGN